MKNFVRTILILTVAILGVEPVVAQLKYVDAKTLTIINKIDQDCAPFSRINAEKYEARKSLGRTSTGVAILFRTNSRIIDAKWTNLGKKIGNNSTPILHSGLDLYIRDKGKWIFAGVGSPKISGNRDTHEGTIVTSMAEGEKLCLLYLPIFDSVGKLEIGIEEDSNITAIENPFRHKIIVHGSSITHGASSNRAGMTYPAIFSRRTIFCRSISPKPRLRNSSRSGAR